MSMRRLILAVAVVATAIAAGGVAAALGDEFDDAGSAAKTTKVPATSEVRSDSPGDQMKLVRVDEAKVRRVQRGMSLKVAMSPSGQVRLVHLVGVIYPSREAGVGCVGSSATKFLQRLLPRGTRITLAPDAGLPSRTKGGALLRFVTQGGNDVGAKLLDRGLAEFAADRITAPTWSEYYDVLASDAKRGGVGIWAGCR